MNRVDKDALNLLGELVMRRVRDRSIGEWHKTVEGGMKDEDSLVVRDALSTFNPQQIELIHRLIPRIVDTTLHHLLWTLEQEETVDVSVRVGDDIVPSIREVSDGLAGEMYGEHGWIVRFSRYPRVDPLV